MLFLVLCALKKKSAPNKVFFFGQQDLSLESLIVNLERVRFILSRLEGSC